MRNGSLRVLLVSRHVEIWPSAPSRCAEAIAAGDGREVRGFERVAFWCGRESILLGAGLEVFVMTEAGQLAVGGTGSGLCAILAGNSASGGGEIELDDCEAASETGDGRSFWALSPSGQLTMGGPLPAPPPRAARRLRCVFVRLFAAHYLCSFAARWQLLHGPWRERARGGYWWFVVVVRVSSIIYFAAG